LFKGGDFCPTIFTDILDDCEYPIFSKPDVGRGSHGVQVLVDQQMHKETIANDDTIFVELLPGNEYTIDCFTNKDGKLLFTGARERALVKMGISFKTYEFELTKEIERIANIINDKLSFRGLWFFQLKEAEDGSLKLLEISTRTAG